MFTITDAQLNKFVTPIVESYGNNNFVARQVAPQVKVDDDEYAYRVWDTSHLRLVNTEVGERGKAVPLDVGMSWVEGKTKDHFGELFIPRKIINKGMKQSIKYVSEESELSAKTMLIEEERKLAAWMIVPGNFTNEAIPGTKWDASGGDPAADINVGIEAVRTAIGEYPNTLVMTPDVLRNLASDHVRSLDGYQAQPSYADILRFFGIDCLKKLIVCASMYETAKKGQTSSKADIWSNKSLWVAYINETASRSAPAFASTFWSIKGTYTEGEASKNPPGQSVLIHKNYDQKIRNETAVYYWNSVLT